MTRYFPGDNHQALVIMADPQALAYQWIVEYAKNISPSSNCDEDDSYGDDSPVDAEEMIEAALSHQGGTWGNYICRGGEYEGFSVDPMFWDKFALVAGIERDDIQQNSFFTCSC